MASSLIGSLRVALSLGTADFEAGANKAASIARGKAKEIESSFAGAKRSIEGLFAAFTVGLLTEQIKKSLEYAGSLAEVSRTLGVTTKDLQTFRFAATQSGVAQDQLEVGLRRLTVSMGKAELGSKAQAKAFEAIGISLNDLKGKDTGEVFRLMADGLSKVSDRSQRAAIEMTLMGRSGSTLDNLLAPGAKRLNDLAAAAQELGIVLSDSQIQGAEETAHKLEAVKTVLEANIAGVVADNAKSIYALADAIAHLIAQLPTAVQQLKAFYAGFLNFSADLSEKIDQAVESPLNRFNPLTAPFRGGALHQNRLNNIKADRAEAAGVEADVRATAIRAFFAQQEARFGPGPRGRAPPRPAGTNLGDVFGGGGKEKKPKKGPTDRSDDVEFQFAQEQRQVDLQILDAKRQLSHNYVEQTALTLQSLDLERAMKDAEIDHKVEKAKQDAAEGRITQSALAQVTAEAGIEKAKEATLDRLKRQAVLEAEQEQHFKDVGQLEDLAFEQQKQKLESEISLAQTAKERRDLELQLLDVTYQDLKNQQERVLADKEATAADKARARSILLSLPDQQAGDRANVLQQTQGPLGQYLDSLPSTAAKWTEALQGVAVNGFGSLEQALMDTISGTKKVGQAFGEMAKSILADLLKIAIQKAIIAPLVNALFPGTGGGINVGALESSNAVGLGLPSNFFGGSVPHFATGGSFQIAGNRGTDQNSLALNGIPIARVSHGENVSIGTGGGGGIVINQTIAPNFAGNAATQDDLQRMFVITKAATMQAIDERRRRNS